MAGPAQIFDGLNEPQKQAATAVDGPLLVVAGPGTGKTLTIVHRIAHLVRQGARPESILAVTFTNRAAREMKERAEALLGRAASNIFIGTFHLLGLRIIRENRLDDFVLLNREEQVELLKSLMKGSAKKAQQAAEDMSRIKNYLAGIDDEVRGIHDAYQAALKQQNAFDFDDLIRIPIELLENAETARKYQNRFTHIIVDEYQDINPAQYCLLRLLAGSAGNVCVVGDADQAIYAFRGADVENFLNFEKDFPGAERVTLAGNYRSSGTIISASSSVIRNNTRRIEKELVPTREQGAQVSVIDLPDDRAEGEFIICELEARMGGTSRYHHYSNTRARGAPLTQPSPLGGEDHGEGGKEGRSWRFSDFAAIYRTNAQARALEEAFAASGIPYQVIGRKSSAQSREIEETLEYLHSLIHADGPAGVVPSDTQEAKLLTPADLFDPRAAAVALMTMHMAKGLEFKVVFIAGCEDGLVPYTMNKGDCDVEEDRRLFYVGMTRAKDELFLLHARQRFLYGQKLAPPASPFLKEIPPELMQITVIPDKMKKVKQEDSQMGLF